MEKRKGKRRFLSRRTILVAWGLLLLLCVCTGIDYWEYPYGVPPGGHSANRGENGL
jgi:hypothetical protein